MHLRAALALQEELGTPLEAARIRVALAAALAAGASEDGMPADVRRLFSAARAQFTTSGAALDLARLDSGAPQ
jgi:hypothetical protein